MKDENDGGAGVDGEADDLDEFGLADDRAKATPAATAKVPATATPHDVVQFPDGSTEDPSLSLGQKTAGPSAFSPSSLGSGIKWNTVEPAKTISLQIDFKSAGTFYGTIFGKTVT